MALLPAVTVLFVAISAALFSYTTYWYVAEEKLSDRIERWSDTQSREKNNIQFDTFTIKGFPLYFDINFEKPAIEIDNSGLKIASDTISFKFKPWNFNKITIIPGRKSWGKLLHEGKLEYYSMQIGKGLIELTHDMENLRTAELELVDIIFHSPLSVDPTTISLLQTSINAENFKPSADLQKETITYKTKLKGISLPPGVGYEMGENIEYLELKARLFGFFKDLENIRSIYDWRDSGGTLEIDSLRGRWGPLELDTSGTITLDNSMTPLAALTADVIGYGDMIDALIMSNAIPLGDAFLAKVAFNMLAKEETIGGPKVLKQIPITIQDGLMSMGPMHLAKIPPLKF